MIMVLEMFVKATVIMTALVTKVRTATAVLMTVSADLVPTAAMGSVKRATAKIVLVAPKIAMVSKMAGLPTVSVVGTAMAKTRKRVTTVYAPRVAISAWIRRVCLPAVAMLHVRALRLVSTVNWTAVHRLSAEMLRVMPAKTAAAARMIAERRRSPKALVTMASIMTATAAPTVTIMIAMAMPPVRPAKGSATPVVLIPNVAPLNAKGNPAQNSVNN